jgi:hypothetical protein
MQYIVIIVIIVIVLVLLEKQSFAKRDKEISDAEAVYRMALKEKDKSRALNCGRNYYALLNAKQHRQNQPLYDSENIIANDIRAMDDAYKK